MTQAPTRPRVGLVLVAVGLALWPWTFGDPPSEDNVIADMRRAGQLFSLQAALVVGGAILALVPARAPTRTAVMLAFAAFAAAALANPWTVGAVLREDGSIDAFGPLAGVLAVQIALIAAGFAALMGWLAPGGSGRFVTAPAIAVVTLVAVVWAAGFWGVALYNRGHSHAVILPSELEEVTDEERRWADDFYRRSLEAALDRGWFDLDIALAQGFEKDPVNRTHYPHPEYMFDDAVLDPERPEWLVFHEHPSGKKVLMALMFFTRELDEVGPTPAGPLALWHYHPYWQPRCAVKGIWTVGKPDGNGECERGEPVMKTPEMFHVWFVEHPLGRYTDMKIVSEYFTEEKFQWPLVHPVLVHFTIALFIIAVLLDFAGLLARRPALHFAAWLNLAIAAVLTFGTVASGMTAEVFAKTTVEGHWDLDNHKLLATGFALVLVLMVTWRAVLRGRYPARGGFIYGLVSLLGVALLTGAGYYGAEMVYRHGTAVHALGKFAREAYWERVEREYLPESRARARAAGLVPASD